MPNIKRFGRSTVNFLQNAARVVRSACQLNKKRSELAETTNSSNVFSRAFCRTVRRSSNNRKKINQSNAPLHPESNHDEIVTEQQQHSQLIILPILAGNNRTNIVNKDYDSDDSISLESGVAYEMDELDDLWSGNSPLRIRLPGTPSDKLSSESGAELELAGWRTEAEAADELPQVIEVSGRVEFEANLQDGEDAASESQPEATLVTPDDRKTTNSIMDSNKTEASDLPPDLMSDFDDVEQDLITGGSQVQDTNKLPSIADEATVASMDRAAAPRSGSNVDGLKVPAAAAQQPSWMSSRLRKVKRGLVSRLRRIRHAVNHRESSESSEAREVRNALDGEVSNQLSDER